MRKVTHFLRHNRKTLAVFAGPSRLDRRIERQQIGLKGKFIDGFDNFAGFFTGRGYIIHGRGQF